MDPVKYDTNLVLTRGVSEILPSKDELEKQMMKGPITLYQGFDPTAPSLHIGHFIGVRKLSQFQKLGHKVIFLIGDFTGMIGDPTDKSAARKKLTKEIVKQNLQDYKKQVSRLLDFEGENAAEVRFNAAWLSKLTFEDVVELASNFTVQQMLERDFFQNRMSVNSPIYLHEFLYPLMQGYDSVAMDVDLEIGGNDQLFNMMTGRHLMQAMGKKNKSVLTMKLLTDPTGKKMGKSEGNAIFLSDSPEDIYGKVMSFPDEIIASAVELLTDLPLEIVDDLHPMEMKKKVALEVVKQVHGDAHAQRAQEHFEETFQRRGVSEHIEEIKVANKKNNIIDLIIDADLLQSRTEVKRLIKDGAVDVNDKTIVDPTSKIEIDSKGIILKVGKKRIVRIIAE